MIGGYFDLSSVLNCVVGRGWCFVYMRVVDLTSECLDFCICSGLACLLGFELCLLVCWLQCLIYFGVFDLMWVCLYCS